MILFDPHNSCVGYGLCFPFVDEEMEAQGVGWRGAELESEPSSSNCGSSSSWCFLVVSWDPQKPTWRLAAPSMTVKTPMKCPGHRKRLLNVWWVEEPQPRISYLHLLETAASTFNFWGLASFSIQCHSVWSWLFTPERDIRFNWDQRDACSWAFESGQITHRDGGKTVVSGVSQAQAECSSSESHSEGLLNTACWAHPQNIGFRRCGMGPENLHS